MKKSKLTLYVLFDVSFFYFFENYPPKQAAYEYKKLFTCLLERFKSFKIDGICMLKDKKSNGFSV